jgi:hypothetical protein
MYMERKAKDIRNWSRIMNQGRLRTTEKETYKLEQALKKEGVEGGGLHSFGKDSLKMELSIYSGTY